MNKHLKTLVGFKNGTKGIAKDGFYEIWDACDELLSALKKIGCVLFVFIVWLFGLALICILPLATWLRLKWEREHENAMKKEVDRIQNGYNPVERSDRGERE